MKKLKYLFFIFPILFCFINNVKADETLDMANWVNVSGRYWSISGLEYSAAKTFNNEVLLNNFNVVGGIYLPPVDTDYIQWSYFERSGSPYNPCGDASFSIDLWFYFTNGNFVGNVKSVRWGDNMCSITDKNSSTGRVYASCIVPHTTSSYNDIFIDYYDFTTNAGVSSDLYISRYNKVICSLDTQSIITNDNINTNRIIDSNNQVKESVNDVNDTLKDDDIDSSNTTDTLSDLSDSLPTNSVISDLLLLPVRLFQSVLNSINGSCTTFNLGSLFGTNLTLPCIDIENLVGSTLWTVIDILFCGAFVLVIRKKFVDIFESLSNLKNGGNEVE